MPKVAAIPPIVQLSSRGQITLPASVRRELGVRSGDPLVVSVEDGRIVLQPAVVVPVELYSDDRLDEFEQNSALSPDELVKAKEAWDL